MREIVLIDPWIIFGPDAQTKGFPTWNWLDVTREEIETVIRAVYELATRYQCVYVTGSSELREDQFRSKLADYGAPKLPMCMRDRHAVNVNDLQVKLEWITHISTNNDDHILGAIDPCHFPTLEQAYKDVGLIVVKPTEDNLNRILRFRGDLKAVKEDEKNATT